MAILPIRLVPDPVLRKKSKRVKMVDPSLQKLINDMIETLHAVPGVGLAAPQVGVPLRVAVISLPEQEDLILVNPEIVRKSGERLIDEGCLSLPGYIGTVRRAVSVTAKARDRNGKEIRIRAKELLAQALEHEINHLNGVLYIDELVGEDQPRKIPPPKPRPQPTSADAVTPS